MAETTATKQTPENAGEVSRWRLCVAPMMDWTDRHCRYFHRLLAPHARLYTEMVTTGAVLHGDRGHLLGFDAAERPVALQLGGHDPIELAACARIGAEFGYDEINLNVGCPSDRVQSGRFGACLMREPALVADGVAAMRAATDIEITVKCRIGVDEQDDVEDLRYFVETLADAGLRTLVVHARKAWLQGLSPKENREIPPLDYARVHALKREFPQLCIVINGGIADVAAIRTHLQHVDGVMLGRAAYHDPYLLAQVEQALYGTPLPARADVLERLRPYIDAHLRAGGALSHVGRHLLGLYLGLPGARAYRRLLSERMHRPGADLRVLDDALAAVAQRRAA